MVVTATFRQIGKREADITRRWKIWNFTSSSLHADVLGLYC